MTKNKIVERLEIDFKNQDSKNFQKNLRCLIRQTLKEAHKEYEKQGWVLVKQLSK